MPANAGIHALLCRDKDKAWIPAFAGMTGGGDGGQCLGSLALAASDRSRLYGVFAQPRLYGSRGRRTSAPHSGFDTGGVSDCGTGGVSDSDAGGASGSDPGSDPDFAATSAAATSASA